METYNLDLLKNKELLIICPTRIRPDQAKEMYNSFVQTRSYNSEIIFYIADNDPKLKEYKRNLSNCAYIIDKRRTIVEVMNYISCELYPDLKYYSIIGDDNRYRTNGWDKTLINEIETKGRGWGIVYGNDLLQKEKLAGNIIISSNIIKTLGYMAYNKLQHLYIDNIWTDIGKGINRLFYRNDIIIEHLHPFINKGKMDENYESIYQKNELNKSQNTYNDWFKNEYQDNVDKIKKVMMKTIIENNDIKLAIAMPTNFTHMAMPVFSSFLLTKKPNYLWLNEQNGFIDDMRNNSVIKAMNSGCTHLFMFDSDMVLHPDVIMKLLENNLDICGALCFKRYPPFYPVLFKQISGDIKKKNLSDVRFDHIKNWNGNDIIEVDAIGTGVIMIKMNVFKKLKPPFFNRIFKNKHNNQDIHFGEDISFCIKAKRAGYKIYSDTSVPCGHLCLHNVNEDDYKLALCLENNVKNNKQIKEK